MRAPEVAASALFYGIAIVSTMTDQHSHWDSVWTNTKHDAVSWHQGEAQICTDLVRRVSTPFDRVAVMGAGTSTLVRELVTLGYLHIEAVDHSQVALDQLRELLGDAASAVRFTCADVRSVTLETPVRVWHDRATFHFLTLPADQALYAERAALGVEPGGHLVMATFSETGPKSCSGLPVANHSANSLAAVFASGFELVESFERLHYTPWGAPQSFTHALFLRKSG